jgi:flagellar hook-length control protein FliK
MNIHALLSMQQGQPNATASAGRSGDTVANGFLQAFSQASNTPLSQNTQAASGQAKGGNGVVSLQQVADQLQALGLSEEQLQQADMQALMEQIRQQPALMDALQALTATLDGGNTGADALLGDKLFQGELSDSSSPLDEITQRLQLMSAFEGAPGSTSMHDTLHQEKQALAGVLDTLKRDGEEGLAETLAALLGGVVTLQNSSAQGSATSSKEPNASTLFSPSLAAIRASAQASDATSQSEAANRALSLLDSTNANNTSRISSDALLAALSSTNHSSPTPSFELPAALQASLNSAGSSAAALQNSASGLSQGATQGSVATPVSSPAWPQQLGQQLVQFAQRGGEQHVQLQLHPAELGPLSISLKVSEQGTQAHFLSAHAQVRQVIEQAIPQLREALAEQGISLAETSVGEQRQQNGDSELANGGGAAGQAGNMLEGDGEDISEAPLPSRTVAIDGRVDLYA